MTGDSGDTMLSSAAGSAGLDRKLVRRLTFTPLFAFVYCLAKAYSVADPTAVYTHCLVDNFAISVSEAVSSPASSLRIWTLAILIHVIPKLFLNFDLVRYYKRHLPTINGKVE